MSNKHTQEQLYLMSDLEINIEVSTIEGEYIGCPNGFEIEVIGDVEYFIDESRNRCSMHLDYCDDWDNIGELILEYEIKIDPRKSLSKLGWMASFDDDNYAVDKNPLRAAAIVYILIKQKD